MKLKLNIAGLVAVAVLGFSVSFAQAASKVAVQDLTLVQEKGAVVAENYGYHHGGYHHGGYHHGGYHHGHHHGHHGHHHWSKPASTNSIMPAPQVKVAS